MKRIYHKYNLAILFTILAMWIIFTPSHFQKGGVDSTFYFKIALFVSAVSMLLTLRYDNFHLAERILVSLGFAFISLFLTALIIGPGIVNSIYGDKTWVLWETKHRLLINFIFYGLNVAILTLLSSLYFSLREKVKAGTK